MKDQSWDEEMRVGCRHGLFLGVLEWSLPVAITKCLLEDLNRKTFGFGLPGFAISMFVQITNCHTKMDLSPLP